MAWQKRTLPPLVVNVSPKLLNHTCVAFLSPGAVGTGLACFMPPSSQSNMSPWTKSLGASSKVATGG